MQPFKIYTVKNAKSTSTNLLATVENQFGFIPNLFAVIAESSPALKAFLELNSQFAASSLNETSRKISL